MKPIKIGLLVAAVTLTGCRKTPPASQEMASMKDMQGMPGMPGMPAPGADTSGVPLGRCRLPASGQCHGGDEQPDFDRFHGCASSALNCRSKTSCA